MILCRLTGILVQCGALLLAERQDHLLRGGRKERKKQKTKKPKNMNAVVQRVSNLSVPRAPWPA